MPRTTTLLETLYDDAEEPLGSLKVTTTTYQLRAWRPSRGRAILTDASRRTLAVASLDDTGWRLGAVGIPDRSAVEPLRRGLFWLSTCSGEHPERLAELLTELSSVLLERSTGKVWRLTTPEGGSLLLHRRGGGVAVWCREAWLCGFRPGRHPGAGRGVRGYSQGCNYAVKPGALIPASLSSPRR